MKGSSHHLILIMRAGGSKQAGHPAQLEQGDAHPTRVRGAARGHGAICPPAAAARRLRILLLILEANDWVLMSREEDLELCVAFD